MAQRLIVVGRWQSLMVRIIVLSVAWIDTIGNIYSVYANIAMSNSPRPDVWLGIDANQALDLAGLTELLPALMRRACLLACDRVPSVRCRNGMVSQGKQRWGLPRKS